MRLPESQARRGRHSPVTSSLMLLAAFLVPAAAHSEARLSEGLKPPQDLELVEASPTTLSLSWKLPPGRPGDGYALFVDYTATAATDEPHYVFSGLRCGTSYTLGVEIVDSSGNRPERASVVAATSACVDAPTPPSREPSPQPTPEPSPAPIPLPAPSPLTSGSQASVPTPVPSVEADSTAPDAGDSGPAIDAFPPGPTRPMSWDGAGAFVWHEAALDPKLLGRELRQDGFGWIAILIHEGTSVEPLDDDWVRQFRAASGLPVGGWGVLRTEPEQEAALAHALVSRHHLDFYIADAEAEYKFSGDDGQSGERFSRSQRFVREFRSLSPELPAAVSSYCRADLADIDWRAWNAAGFSFLPQAYANDLGSAASPSACVAGATGFFSPQDVHPTIGMYRGNDGRLSPEEYAKDLAAAHVVGFSVYLADNAMSARDWTVLGHAIRERGIAQLDPTGDVDAAPFSVPRRGGIAY